MKTIKITAIAIRKADYKNLQQKYENPIQHACDIQEGQVFIANGCHRRHMNHSKEFYAEIDRVFPDYKRSNKC